MKSGPQNVFQLFVVLLLATAVGCAETDGAVSHEDPWESFMGADGKADVYGVTDNSPEGVAVIGLVNEASFDVLNERGHVSLDIRAARNIVEYRQSKNIETLAELDSIKWVGRSAFGKLLQYAIDNNMVQRREIDCAEFFTPRRGVYIIRSYADLLDYQGSLCTHLHGDLHIQIQGTDLLPPQHREVKTLRHLRYISGELRIQVSNHYNSIHFDGLETIGKDLVATEPSTVRRSTALYFPALTQVNHVELTRIRTVEFSVLPRVNQLNLTDGPLTGYPALTNATAIHIRQNLGSAYLVDFPALEEVGLIHIRMGNSQREAEFSGGFPALKEVEKVQVQYGKYTDLSFDVLERADEISSDRAIDFYPSFPRLLTLHRLVSRNDVHPSGFHAGPPSLQRIHQLTVQAQEPIKGYEKLQAANSISVDSPGVEGFNALTEIRVITVNLRNPNSESKLSGFNKVSALLSLRIQKHTGTSPTQVGDLFFQLEEVENALEIRNWNSFDRNPHFPALVRTGSLQVDRILGSNEGMFPSLEVVRGTVGIRGTPQTMQGFDKLTMINGDLNIAGNLRVLQGMGELEYLDGNLTIPRSFNGQDLDDFLLQFIDFDGTIRFQ